MIRTEKEYKEAVERLQGESKRLRDYEKLLQDKGETDDEIKLSLDPFRSFHQQLSEEVAEYERVKRGEFGTISNFRGLGHLLICLRIARGISQRELAEKLDVNESQISRDERNEYRNISTERAERTLEALGYCLQTTVCDKQSNDELVAC